jgi:hypothetical protein
MEKEKQEQIKSIDITNVSVIEDPDSAKRLLIIDLPLREGIPTQIALDAPERLLHLLAQIANEELERRI